MMHRYKALVFVAAISGLILVTSTSGYNSVMERPVDAEVAEDPAAYVGFEQRTNSRTNTSTDLEITITNNIGHGISLQSVFVNIGDKTTNAREVEGDHLDPNESLTFTFTNVSCGESITVVASGSGVHVSLNRTVNCP